MQLIDNKLILSPTDLNKYLVCKHYINLEKIRLDNKKAKITFKNPLFEILADKGLFHENKYLEYLKKNFKSIKVINEKQNYEEKFKLTLDAFKSNTKIICHPFIMSENWIAVPDFFIKDTAKNEYIVADTKLKKTLIPEHIYQSVIYALMAEDVFEIKIKMAKIISPSDGIKKFVEHDFFIKDYLGDVKEKMIELEKYINSHHKTRPIPCSLCKNCEFNSICEKKLNDEKSLFTLSNITRLQEKRFRQVNVKTITDLINNEKKPKKMSIDTYKKIKLKAELRMQKLSEKKPSFKIIDENALKMLPEKSNHDIYFDIEGDPLTDGGLEYLFGLLIKKEKIFNFKDIWAHNSKEEKNATSKVIKILYNQCIKYNKAHIYHYNTYEVNALRRLSQKYNTCEQELDELLRGERFIDLYTIVRKLLITSEKGLSLKDLEVFFLEKRNESITDATSSIIMYDLFTKTLKKEILEEIRLYNEQDCRSLPKLRNWMENIVIPGFKNQRSSIPINETVNKQISVSDEKNKNENLAIAISQFHKKEDKPYWWSYFDAKKSVVEELILDSSILAGLTKKIEKKGLQIGEYKYYFPEQDHKFSKGSKVAIIVPDSNVSANGEIIYISDKDNEIILKINKPNIQDFSIIHLKEPMPPKADNIIKNLEDFLQAILKKNAQNMYPASFSLLSYYQAKLEKSQKWMETIIEHENVYKKNKPLFVQGPPGSGKTYQGAIFLKNILEDKNDIICLVTSQGHKAIENILLYLKKICPKAKDIILKYGGKENTELNYINGYGKLFSLLKQARQNKSNLIIGITVFGISKLREYFYEEKRKPSDFLIIDEAGQYGLANSIAASMFTDNVILLGDQNQLPNVTQGSHAMGIEKSVMSFCLGNNSVVGKEHGIFLPTTRRLHPKICNYISDCFYQSQLKPHPLNKNRSLVFKNKPDEDLSGINLIELEHDACVQTSDEELIAINNKINYLIQNCFLIFNNKSKEIAYKDFIIVSPYNAQVNYLKATLGSEFNIGTVDKFQGQEAPITIISMTSSTVEDAPKGIEFLLNENRLNVAISRAQVAVFLFCAKGLFNAVGKSIKQMQLINKFCQIKKYIN